jgi:hypothetical protein
MENIRVTKKHDGPADEPETETVEEAQEHEDFRRVESWFIHEQQAQSANRFLMAKCQDFVDGDQYTEEDRAEIEGRGQSCLTFNLVATTTRWITGTEKRTRVDYNVVGRGKEDNDAAENKTALLKYLDDVNHGGHQRSMAFEDTVGAGLGWIEVGVKGDPGEEPLVERYESWRNVWHDRLALAPDVSDGRYIFRAKWLDLDVAQAYFPDKKDILESAAEEHEYNYSEEEFATQENYQNYAIGASADNHHNKRRRVRLIECWYKKVENCKVIKSKCGANKAILHEDDPRLMEVSQASEVYDSIKQVMHLMIFVSNRESGFGQVIHAGRSPYWHNRFPLVPMFCYRNKRTNLPYGVVKDLIDPQEDLNKRRSKALFILSTNKILMEDGAVDDLDELAEESARPDGIIQYKKGFQLQLLTDKALAHEHVMLMEQDAAMIQKVAGVTDENLGRQTNATSGKAIEIRQNQGNTVTADIFDNYRLAMQTIGQLKLSLIEQYYSEEKTLRIIGENGRVEYKDIDGSITDSQADFIVDEQAFNQSTRQAMFGEMMNLLGAIAPYSPEVAVKLLDVVVDMWDGPQRNELVSRIREVNGMRDSNQELTPEEQQAEHQQQQMQQEAMERQIRLESANVALAEAKVDDLSSKTAANMMEMMMKKLEAMERSLEVAGVLQANPLLGPAADQIIEDAV